MKIKKLLAFLLCFVLLFTGLPVIAASADNSSWQTLNLYTRTITQENYTKAFYGDFTVSSRGVIQFDATRLYMGSQKAKFYFEIYSVNDLDNPVWSSNTDKFEDGEGNYFSFIGLNAGTYRAVVRPSLYSSYFSSGQTYTFNFGFYYYTAANNFEIEANNTKETATPLTSGKTIRAFSDYSEDYFSINVTKATLAKIKIKNYDKLASDNVYVKLWLADGSSADYLLDSEASVSAPYYTFLVQLKAGTNYLNVTTNSNVGQDEYWIEVTTNAKLDTPVVYKKNKTSSLAEVYWNVVAGADGYEIQRKFNKEGWKLALTNVGATRNGLKQSGDISKNTYQFRIRAYKKIGSTKIYSSWSKVVAFHPTPTNIKLSASSYTYSGTVKKPKVTVKNALGTTLKENVDYKVSYASGRKNVGKYKVVVTFKGDYSGKKTVYFKINPKATSISAISARSKGINIKFKKQSTQTSGYQIQYSAYSSFSSAKTLTIKSNKTTSAVIKNLSGNKKYYVRVRTYKKAGGSTLYSGWSSAKAITTKY